jgi:PhnB protein
MKITPYLNFPGTCAEAFTFYVDTLGGEITFMQTHGDSPMKDMVGPDWQDKVMHATLLVGDHEISGSDAPLHMFAKPAGFMVTINPADPDHTKRIFAAFAEGGEVKMALQETFWTPLFGMVTDRFGTPWMISLEADMPS